MDATVHNMRLVSDRPGVFAYDPDTGDRWSATPGDYFYMPENEPLRNDAGNVLLLAQEIREIELLGA